MSKEDEVKVELVEGQEVEETSEEEADYDEMFHEMWSDKSESADPDPINAEESDEEDELEQSAEAAEEAAEEAEDPTDATEGDEEEEVESEEAKIEQAASDDPYAWIDTLPEEVKDKAAHLREQAKSHHGRATAFQRRAAELEDELRRAQKSREAEPADLTPKSPEPAAPKTLEKLERLKEDFPEFAEALEEVITSERERVNETLRNELKPLQDDRAQARSRQFVDVVDNAAAEIFNTKETGVYWKDVVEGDDFRAWLQVQPASVQTAASTPSAREAVHVLRLFETDYQAALAEQESNTSSQEEISEPASKQTTRAKQLKEKRKKRREQSAAPGSKPAGSARQGGGDYDEMFDAMWG